MLRNKLGIVDPHRASLVETELLRRVYFEALDLVEPTLVIDQVLIRALHRSWLSPIYPFAGELRTVNVSKSGFLFSPAPHLAQGLGELDAVFRRTMPCVGTSRRALADAIAESHAELVLLHPFRDGNGRLARLVADVMAVQAGFDPLKWNIADLEGRGDYFLALRRGFVTDYHPLAALVLEALQERSSEAPPR